MLEEAARLLTHQIPHIYGTFPIPFYIYQPEHPPIPHTILGQSSVSEMFKQACPKEGPSGETSSAVESRVLESDPFVKRIEFHDWRRYFYTTSNFQAIAVVALESGNHCSL